MSTTDRIHISNNLDNLDNEWGFYIDLENLLPVLPEQYQPKHDYDCEYFAEHYDDFDNGYDDYYNTYVPYSEGKNKYIPVNNSIIFFKSKYSRLGIAFLRLWGN